MSVDEYIVQYGPTELDRLIYRDFQKMKSQMRDIAPKTTRDHMLGESNTLKATKDMSNKLLESSGAAIKRRAREKLQGLTNETQRTRSDP